MDDRHRLLGTAPRRVHPGAVPWGTRGRHLLAPALHFPCPLTGERHAHCPPPLRGLPPTHRRPGPHAGRSRCGGLGPAGQPGAQGSGRPRRLHRSRPGRPRPGGRPRRPGRHRVRRPGQGLGQGPERKRDRWGQRLQRPGRRDHQRQGRVRDPGVREHDRLRHPAGRVRRTSERGQPRAVLLQPLPDGLPGDAVWRRSGHRPAAEGRELPDGQVEGYREDLPELRDRHRHPGLQPAPGQLRQAGRRARSDGPGRPRRLRRTPARRQRGRRPVPERPHHRHLPPAQGPRPRAARQPRHGLRRGRRRTQPRHPPA